MINKTPAWQALKAHQAQLQQTTIGDLLSSPARFEQCSEQAPHWLLDFSRNKVTDETLSLLIQLAETAELPQAIQAMFSGEKINTTEQRAVLHSALRDPHTTHTEVKKTLDEMAAFCKAVHDQTWRGYTDKPITDIVNIGIGGSNLGPKLVVDALRHYAQPAICSHFVSNIDPTDLARTLETLNPETTLFVMASKTFTTIETMTNAKAAKHWLQTACGEASLLKHHFVAVTASPEKAAAFGIDVIFPFWDWVGGRYSLWSAIGLPIALSLGMDHFRQLLSGAHAVDQHFQQTDLQHNVPVLMGLLGIWHHNFLGMPTHAVIPYASYLHLLPAFLQQLDMESNGKRVNKAGQPVDYQTGPVIWGGVGSDTQHSFHQLLHQGTQVAGIDFILFKESLDPIGDQQTMLFANGIAQAQALACGRTLAQADNNPHRVMPGDRPSNLLLCDRLTPESLGALLALYEHKVFTQGVIWGINSFDQFGVELGKALANQCLAALESKDESTIGAIEWFKTSKK
jgi:glucose-6-phosphate isomerase